MEARASAPSHPHTPGQVGGDNMSFLVPPAPGDPVRLESAPSAAPSLRQ